MLKKVLLLIAVSVITMVLTTVFQPLSLVRSIASNQLGQGQPDNNQTCQIFYQAGRQEVCGRFLAYWYKYGGVRQFGYPVSFSFREISDVDGKEYVVQYFERAVFELHPENQPPYDVLLSQLGREKLEQKYPYGTSNPAPIRDPQPEVNVSKQLRPGIYIRLIRQEQAAITGLYTGYCDLQMTWVLQIENRSTAPFVATLDNSNLKMLDSTGKSYAPLRKCGDTPITPYSGSFGGPWRLGPGDFGRGTIDFQVQDIPMSASYFQLEVSFSGAPIEFQYMLP